MNKCSYYHTVGKCIRKQKKRDSDGSPNTSEIETRSTKYFVRDIKRRHNEAINNDVTWSEVLHKKETLGK